MPQVRKSKIVGRGSWVAENKETTTMNDLIIIGAGAGGLMASVYAAESGINAITLERRHRPGLKLLMCGNNRCNISHDASVETCWKPTGSQSVPF